LYPAATRHFGTEFGCENPVHLQVCVTRVEERYELLGSVAPIHVEGEQTALLAADVACQALQLFPFILPGRVVTSYESQDVGHKLYDAVRIKVECTRRLRAEL